MAVSVFERAMALASTLLLVRSWRNVLWSRLMAEISETKCKSNNEVPTRLVKQTGSSLPPIASRMPDTDPHVSSNSTAHFRLNSESCGRTTTGSNVRAAAGNGVRVRQIARKSSSACHYYDCTK